MVVRPVIRTLRVVCYSKSPPFSFQRQLTTASTTTLTDFYWKALQNSLSNPTVLERTLTQIKTNLDFSSVENVIQKSCINGHWLLGLRFFIWAGQQSNYQHSPLMYSKASEILNIAKQPKTLVDVIDVYRKEGSSVTIKAFKVILNLCREAKLPNQALEILKKMEEFGCRPDTTSYNIVIRLFCEKNEVDMAKGLMEQMALGGLYPDMITFVVIIKGFCSSGRLEDARKIVCDMQNHGCTPNAVVYSMLLDGICRSASLEMALEFLGEMEKNENDSCKPNVVCYTSLIQSLCEKGMATKAMCILHRMKERGCAPNWVTIGKLADGLCAEGFLNEAYELIERMVADGNSTDRAYSSLLISLLRTGNLQGAEKLMGRLVASGVKPNGLACSSMIKRFCFEERPLDAFGWFTRLEKECIDSDVYHFLLEGLLQQGHVVEATEVVDVMLERRVQMRVSHVDTIADALMKAGDNGLALRLLSIKRELMK